MQDYIFINDERIRLYNIHNFPYDEIPVDFSFRDHNTRKKQKYRLEFGCFDIETTSVIESYDDTGNYESGYGYMYIWQFCTIDKVCIGRTWEEFIALLKNINLHFAKTGTSATFVIYVHNLSWEFQFMYALLDYQGITGKVFAVKSRKVLTYKLDTMNIEFRCSYKLTNRGLAKYLKDMPTGLEKMVGDLDYKIKRTPKSELTEAGYGYCVVDVLGLYRSLKKDMAHTGHDISTIPLTSTGYIRKELHSLIDKDKSYQKMLSESALTMEQYQLVERLKKGGDTLASMSNPLGTIFKDVGSADFVSSYPARLCINNYPQGKLTYEIIDSMEDIDDLEKECRYYILEFIADNVSLKNPIQPIPCISLAKCDFADNAMIYNGRVLKSTQIGIAMDMITFQMFREQYKYTDIVFGDCYSCEYKPLPDVFKNFVLKKFENKCIYKERVKDLEKQGKQETEEYNNACLDLLLEKNKFNGIFGMCYTDPLHDVYEIRSDKDYEWIDIDIDYESEEAKKQLYENQCKGVGLFLWGVHTAALGRLYLSKMIDAIGWYNTLYCDTDSDKFKINDKSLAGIKSLNEQLKDEAIKAGAYYQSDKKTYYLGMIDFENEDNPYQEFITLGAKKYAYRENGVLHMTLAGVAKSEVSQLNDDIRNFKSGFVFNPAGGITLHYNDAKPHLQKVIGDDGTTDTILLGSNICAIDRVITLGYILDDRGNAQFGSMFSECMDLMNVTEIE